MTLTDYLEGMRAATTATALEQAIQATFTHAFRGRTWIRICNVRIEAGRHICYLNPLGRFVPLLGPRRKLTLCGETYWIGSWQNSAGERYCWHYAKEWAEAVLRANGFTDADANLVWQWCLNYPHRALAIVETARAPGYLPGPMH